MRWIVSLLLLAALAAPGLAQEPDKKPEGEQPGGAEPGAKKDAGPKEAPAWKLPDKERKKVEKYLRDYLQGKSRSDILEKFKKYLEKSSNEHSALEDVLAITDIVNRLRIPNPKAGRKGRVSEVEVSPEVHGFPGGIGTVKYNVYLPKNYDLRKGPSPLLFCLPDNQVKDWHDGKKFIEEIWTTRSAKVRDDYIVVVPHPQSKGESWSRPKSYARAMIALRHALGTFDSDKKTAGPYSDTLRVFVDGGDVAAMIAGRFPEMLAGAILRGADGTIGTSRTNLRKAGGLSGLPAYSIYDPSKKSQKQFAEKLRGMNDKSLLVAAKDSTKFPGDAEAIAKWMESLTDKPETALAAKQPRKIQYTVHEPSFQRHFWINVLEFDASVKPAASLLAQTDRAKNEVVVDVNGISRFEIFLNDAIVDLNKELRIVVLEDGKEPGYEFYKGKPARNLDKLLAELVASNSPWRIYPVQFEIDVPLLREQARKKAEEEAAKKKAEQGGGGGEPGKSDTGTESSMGK